MDALEQLRQAIGVVVPVGLERSLYPVTAYVILPLFARFNRGVLMDSGDVKALADPVGLGLQFGLLIGKQVGITAASWIVICFGLAEMPSGVNWGQIHSSAILASVGFTMSLFVSELAFPLNNSSG
jgi:Na+:H+ antiporter, NhaA family